MQRGPVGWGGTGGLGTGLAAPRGVGDTARGVGVTLRVSPTPTPQGPGRSAALQDQGGAEAPRGAAAGQEGGDHQNPLQGGGGQEVTLGCPLPLSVCSPIKPGLFPASLRVCSREGIAGNRFPQPRVQRPLNPQRLREELRGWGEVWGAQHPPEGLELRAGNPQSWAQTAPAAPGWRDGRTDRWTRPG